MIAYNNDWLRNLLIREQAEEASMLKCITEQEEQNIYAANPVDFYTPNLFVRIGLFILTTVIALFSLGLFLLVFMSASEKQIGGMLIFFGLLVYTALEVMVSRRHYKSGVDDALMWIAPVCIVCGFNIIANISWLENAFIVFILAFFLFIRFTNMLIAGIAGISFSTIIFLAFIKFGEIAKALTPFVIMITAAFIYLVTRQLLRKEKYKLYIDGIAVISVTSLLSFYIGGNYFAVRETSIAMFDLNLAEGQTIPLGWLFWVFTFIIPVMYIARGIQKKDIVLLRVGLLLVAAVVFTVRYYYHLLPIEIAGVIGGILFIVIAYALIKYLREPKYGFTYKKENDPLLMDKLQVESLIIAQTFTGTAQAVDTGVQFGGGSGGGAGASGEF